MTQRSWLAVSGHSEGEVYQTLAHHDSANITYMAVMRMLMIKGVHYYKMGVLYYSDSKGSVFHGTREIEDVSVGKRLYKLSLLRCSFRSQ